MPALLHHPKAESARPAETELLPDEMSTNPSTEPSPISTDFLVQPLQEGEDVVIVDSLVHKVDDHLVTVSGQNLNWLRHYYERQGDNVKSRIRFDHGNYLEISDLSASDQRPEHHSKRRRAAEASALGIAAVASLHLLHHK